MNPMRLSRLTGFIAMQAIVSSFARERMWVFMKAFIVRHGFLLRLIVTLLLIICVPILMLSLFAVRRAYADYQDAVTYVSKNNLAQYATAFNSHYDNMLYTARRIGYERKLTLDTATRNAYSVRDIMAAMDNYKAHTTGVSRLGIFFGDDYIYTDNGRYGLNNYLRDVAGKGVTDSSPLKEEEQWIYTTMEESIRSFRGRSLLFSTFGRLDNKSAGLYILVPIHSVSRQSDYAMVIFEMPAGHPFDLGRQKIFSSDLFAILGNGGTILMQDAGLPLEELLRAELSDFVKNSQKEFFTTEGDPGYSVYKLEDDLYTYLLFTAEQPVDTRLGTFYVALNRMGIWMTVLLVFLCAISVYITYRPIIRLVRQVKKTASAQGGVPESELDTISATVSAMDSHNTELQLLITSQRQRLAGNALKMLMEGAPVQAQEIEQLMTRLTDPCYCVILLAFPHSDPEKPCEIPAAALLTPAVAAHTPLPQHRGCEALVVNLTGISRDERERLARDLFRAIESVGLKPCIIGVGIPVSSLSEIRSSYLTATSALENGEREHITLYEDVEETFGHLDEFPGEEMERMVKSVKLSDGESALQALNRMIEMMRTNITSTMMRRYLCFRVTNTLTQTLSQLGVSFSTKEIAPTMQFDDLDTFQEALTALIKKACSDIAHIRQEQIDRTIGDILDYVNAHLADPDIGLVSIADALNLPDYTVSRMFKKAMHTGFNDYLTERRVECAKAALLAEPKKNIRDIASSLGFRDESYFIKVFKKVTGLTPNSFRKI